jgi:hypothetical protein
MKWMFLAAIFSVCHVKLSSQQLNLNSNPYRPLLDSSNDYDSLLPEEIQLEYKIDKMPSRTYDWSFVAAGNFSNASFC